MDLLASHQVLYVGERLPLEDLTDLLAQSRLVYLSEIKANSVLKVNIGLLDEVHHESHFLNLLISEPPLGPGKQSRLDDLLVAAGGRDQFILDDPDVFTVL